MRRYGHAGRGTGTVRRGPGRSRSCPSRPTGSRTSAPGGLCWCPGDLSRWVLPGTGPGYPSAGIRRKVGPIGWNGEVARPHRDGYLVRAFANPLRGLTSDAAELADFLKTIPGPIVLVGHSYGGSVITNAAAGNS